MRIYGFKRGYRVRQDVTISDFVTFRYSQSVSSLSCWLKPYIYQTNMTVYHFHWQESDRSVSQNVKLLLENALNQCLRSQRV